MQIEGKTAANFETNSSHSELTPTALGPHLSVVGAGGIVGTLGRLVAVPLALCEPQAHHLDKGCRAHRQQLHIPAHV